MKINLKTMVTVAMLSAIATVLFLVKIPLPFIAPPFYEIDLSGVAALIAGFAYGPIAGVLVELFKNLINLAIDGTNTGYVGELSNFITGCAYVLPASLIYKHFKNRKFAIIGMAVGVIVMTVFGYFSNVYVMIPAYSKFLPLDVIISMGAKIHPSINSVEDLVLLCVVPFNIIKGIVVAVVTFVFYKKIRNVLH